MDTTQEVSSSTLEVLASDSATLQQPLEASIRNCSHRKRNDEQAQHERCHWERCWERDEKKRVDWQRKREHSEKKGSYWKRKWEYLYKRRIDSIYEADLAALKRMKLDPWKTKPNIVFVSQNKDTRCVCIRIAPLW